MPRTEPSLVVCDRCGMAHRWVPLQPRMLARCTRCDAILARGHRLQLQSLLALNLAALVVLLIANLSDILTIRLGGGEAATNFPQAVVATWDEGERLVAAIAALSGLVAPALFIGLRLYLLVPLSLGRVAPGFATCVRLLHEVSRWNTVEVLTVAALLSLVRIAALAQATVGPALVALGALALLLAAIESAGLKHLWWHVR